MGALDERYGVLFHSYWTGPTGRAIQAAGKDPCILGLYLATNRYANMIGLYELPLMYVEHDLPVLGGDAAIRLAAIRLAFQSLSTLGFAYYDEATEIVWVREMARIRCGLPNATLKINPRDKKAIAVFSLYATIRPNPYLGAFHDRYGAQLGLPTRREPSPPAPSMPHTLLHLLPHGSGSVAASEPHQQGASVPLASPSEVRTEQNRDQGSGDQNRNQNRHQNRDQGSVNRTGSAPPNAARPSEAVENSDSNPFHRLARVARRLLETGSWIHDGEQIFIRTEADLVDAMKDECAREAIPREGDTLRKACSSEWFKHTHPEIVGRPTAVPS